MQIVPNKRKRDENDTKQQGQENGPTSMIASHDLYSLERYGYPSPRQNSNLLLKPNLQFKHSILQS